MRVVLKGQLGLITKATKAYEKLGKTVKDWSYSIPENENNAYRILDKFEVKDLAEGNPLRLRSSNPSEEIKLYDQALRAPKGKINLYKPSEERGGRKQFAKGHPWRGTTVTHGEPFVLSMPGHNLPWTTGRHFRWSNGQAAKLAEIDFEEAPIGSHIDLKGADLKALDFRPAYLKDTYIYEPFKIFGKLFGWVKRPLSYYTSSNKGLDIIDTWREVAANEDVIAASRALSDWWKLKAPDSKFKFPMFFHGSKRAFNKFDDTYEYVGADEPYFFTTDRNYAQQYVKNNGSLRRFFLNIKDPLYVREPLFRDSYLKEVAYKGKDNDAIIGHDLITEEGLTPSKGYEVAVPLNTQMKLAEPFTYDDEGNLIDITLRFNFANPDIRYGWGRLPLSENYEPSVFNPTKELILAGAKTKARRIIGDADYLEKVERLLGLSRDEAKKFVLAQLDAADYPILGEDLTTDNGVYATAHILSGSSLDNIFGTWYKLRSANPQFMQIMREKMPTSIQFNASDMLKYPGTHWFGRGAHEVLHASTLGGGARSTNPYFKQLFEHNSNLAKNVRNRIMYNYEASPWDIPVSETSKFKGPEVINYLTRPDELRVRALKLERIKLVTGKSYEEIMNTPEYLKDPDIKQMKDLYDKANYGEGNNAVLEYLNGYLKLGGKINLNN